MHADTKPEQSTYKVCVSDISMIGTHSNSSMYVYSNTNTNTASYTIIALNRPEQST